MESKGIVRNPPWQLGAEVLMAADIQDTLDWGQNAHGLKELWPLGTGKGVLVGVLDTGRPDHFDLAEKVKYSKNFSSSFTDLDTQGHSTHVCGTVAAAANGRGVVGVAPDAQLCIAKVLGDDGSGSTSDVARGIRWCLEKDCDILSMSLGGGHDPDVAAAVKEAVQAGKFVICAAGNDGSQLNRNTVNWPARLDEVVAVASYNADGRISQFSSRGPEVDVAFPGENILSCWLDNKYRRISGTSMATPFCSGAVAMLLSHQRELERQGKVLEVAVRNNFELLARLKAVAADRGSTGHDNDWGWGVVDMTKLLKIEAQLPPTTTVPPTTTLPPDPNKELQLGPFSIAVRRIDGQEGLFIYWRFGKSLMQLVGR